SLCWHTLMWFPLKIDGRGLEWHVQDGPNRYLHIRSLDGDYRVQSTILDDVFARDEKGRVVLSAVGAPLVIGPEFPFGHLNADVPFSLEGGFEFAPYGIIHTELVRSFVGRWACRRRYRRRTRALPSPPNA